MPETPRTDTLYSELRNFTNEDEATDALAKLRDHARLLEKENAALLKRLATYNQTEEQFAICREALTIARGEIHTLCEERDIERRDAAEHRKMFAGAKAENAKLREAMAAQMYVLPDELAELRKVKAQWDEAEVIGIYKGTPPHRDWWTGGEWLRPGDRVLVAYADR